MFVVCCLTFNCCLCCSLLVVGNVVIWSVFFRCSLFGVLLLNVCCLLIDVNCLLFGRCVMFVACWSLFVVCFYGLFRCLLFVACVLLLLVD